MKFSILLIAPFFIGFSVIMSFNPTFQHIKTESTMVSRGLEDFKSDLEHLKKDAHLFSEDQISHEKLKKSLRITRNSYEEAVFYIAYH